MPQQVFSFQHLVDFALPLMRKGTDSRTGFGFRVGNHSDFQVTFEIGPQKFTRPLGMSQLIGIFLVLFLHVIIYAFYCRKALFSERWR